MHSEKYLKVAVNCKVNLGLNIVEKRNDGYHNIETIFIPTDFYTDELSISYYDKDDDYHLLIESKESLGNPKDNLCDKAIELIRKDYNVNNIDLKLTKGIPVGAGLGGGSADAAYTLLLINYFLKLHIPKERLFEYAGQLGSDVPFFLINSPVFATGRGEIMTPIDLDLSDYELKIVNPGIHISTKEAYESIKPSKPEISLTEAIKQPIQDWKNIIKNDFEAPIFKRYPQLAKIKEDMYRDGAVYASMSGSGSSIYGLFKK